MAQLWYYEITHVALLQDRPPDWSNINMAAPRLTIGNYETAVSKYQVQAGFWQNGQRESSFDYSEFALGRVTTSRPSDYETAKISYERESLDGGMVNVTRQKWGVLSVPDFAVLPDEFRIDVPDHLMETTIEELKSYADTRGFAVLRLALERSEQILAAQSLHELIAGHLDQQFTLLDMALNGEISAQELMEASDLVAQEFLDDLVEEGDLPESTADLIDLAFRVHEYTGFGFSGPDGQVETDELRTIVPDGFSGVMYVGDGKDETLLGSRQADQIAMGAGNDIAYGRQGDDYIDGGAGDDVLIGGQGFNYLVGGEGSDTAVYAGSLSDYFLNTISGRTYVVSRTPGSNYANDTLDQIDRFWFSDGIVFENDSTPLVSSLYYFSRNPDVWQADSGQSSPDFHFANWGWREGRDPNALFSTTGYLGANDDVARAGVNPLVHYELHGWREGRDPSSEFDTQLYLLRNPDVASAGINPLSHYLSAGAAEGRPIYEAIGKRIEEDGFDREFYLLANPDVAAADIDAREHFENFGWKEGRDPNALFDTEFYLFFNPDVAAAKINPFAHFDEFGWEEGRNTYDGFSSRGYLEAYSDVADADLNPLYHYLQYGVWEGRHTFSDEWIIA
ncbi:calcium-binding protein [Rhizobium sp. EC-SD404]|uniref:calcium-binding protein n=1 Tax=Rhizobium sp. EC-SD404 TaxID=2038389 RepID=UPI00125A0F31|nr:calcium-binding protein [Rhizobium sp. EC-SD404]VVT32931.1 hypothetical protein RHIZ404_230658 [Rhizobium sp. EC-SD404]